MTTSFLAMLKDDEGATLVEYGLVVSLIAVAAIVAITTLGGKVSDTFNAIANKITPPS
ncbi:MAG TPA: Flp family type IVb pilin [Candidatus Elarobacter sp.]|nr:Flp family type IVb pilin [Candidatus Elarobacter sp.]HTD35911.1 Flp family type IVb pilin [Candidatus Limnocylindrales bacterium]